MDKEEWIVIGGIHNRTVMKKSEYDRIVKETKEKELKEKQKVKNDHSPNR